MTWQVIKPNVMHTIVLKERNVKRKLGNMMPSEHHAKGERFEELPVERFETHTRAFIKVEDGCNRHGIILVAGHQRHYLFSSFESEISIYFQLTGVRTEIR